VAALLPLHALDQSMNFSYLYMKMVSCTKSFNETDKMVRKPLFVRFCYQHVGSIPGEDYISRWFGSWTYLGFNEIHHLGPTGFHNHFPNNFVICGYRWLWLAVHSHILHMLGYESC
jgi:hypothetical protein